MASFVLSMNTATADGSRALYGIARDGMTIKQLYHLNRFHVPARAMTLDMLVNIGFVFFIGNIFGILAASNIGYMIAHVFALTAFVLLRRDRPDWPRPIELVAVLGADRRRAGGDHVRAHDLRRRLVPDRGNRLRRTTEKIIGFGVLVIAILLFLFRRIVQDGERPLWREETPLVPDAAQRALMEQESRTVS